jgi:hypothetical protein
VVLRAEADAALAGETEAGALRASDGSVYGARNMGRVWPNDRRQALDRSRYG